MVDTYGFDYTFQYFVNLIFDDESDVLRVRELLFVQFEEIEAYTVDKYLLNKVHLQLNQVINSVNIESKYKILIAYNLYKVSLKNHNLIIIKEEIIETLTKSLTEYYEILGNESDGSDIQKAFIEIFKNFFIFNKRIDEIHLLFESYAKALSTYPININRIHQSKMLLNSLIMLYGFICKDAQISKNHKSVIRLALSKNINIGFNDDTFSLKKAINKNLHELLKVFFNTINLDKVYDSDYEYIDYNSAVGKVSIFTPELFSNIYGFMVVLRHAYFNPASLFAFENSSQLQKIKFLKTFIEMFQIVDDHIIMTSKAQEEFTMFCELFEIDTYYALNDGEAIREVFEYVNSEAKKVHQLLNSKLPISQSIHEEKHKYIFNNIKYFGTESQIDNAISETFTINFGINNTSDLTLDVMKSLLDSTFELEVIRIILKNKLFFRTIKPSSETLQNLLDEISAMELDTVSNDKAIKYRFRDYMNENFIKIVNSLAAVQKQSGFESVIIKSSEFGYWIDDVTLVRRQLSDEEADMYIKSNLMIQNDIIKIDNLYYSYQEAFIEVKKLYAKDEIVVTYRIRSSSKAGIILHFN